MLFLRGEELDRKIIFDIFLLNILIKLPNFLNLILPTDAVWLLRFLRTKKFNVPMAQEATERYLLLRQVYNPAFHNLDISEPIMDELLSLGYAKYLIKVVQ